MFIDSIKELRKNKKEGEKDTESDVYLKEGKKRQRAVQ